MQVQGTTCWRLSDRNEKVRRIQMKQVVLKQQECSLPVGVEGFHFSFHLLELLIDMGCLVSSLYCCDSDSPVLLS